MKSFVNSLITVVVAHSTLLSADIATESPLSPEFLQWRESKNREIRSHDNRVSGIIPSPTNNREFLRNNPVKKSSSRSNLPMFFDLRTSNLVSPVKNQKRTGNCWAFTTYGSLESSLLRDGSGLFDFSEKNLRNNRLYDGDPISDGGNSSMSIAYLSRLAGPVLEEFDPFDDTDPTSDAVPAYGIIKQQQYFTDEESIKDAIMSIGALYTTMCSSDPEYKTTDGTTTYYLEGKWQENHGVTLVGWDDTRVVPGAPANGAWLVKNSWGENWGDDGYFWLSYFDQSSVLEAISFNTVEPMQQNDIYYYDTLGFVSQTGFGQDVAYAAIKVTPRQNENIIGVGTYAVVHNASYKIRIYDTKTEQSGDIYFSDLLYETEGPFGNSGYYMLDLPKEIPVTEGNDIYVVVEYTTPDFSVPIPFEKKIDGYTSSASSNAGESFYSHDGTVFEDIASKGSACIKVLTSSGAPRPYPLFTSNTQMGTPPATIQFTDKSLNNPTKWEWDFNGDGVTDSEEQNPSYTYDKEGKYSVRLITSNDIGTDTLIKTDYITILSASLTGDTVYITSGETAEEEAGYFPMSPFIDNSWVSSIYTAEEVQKRARIISGIQFNKTVSTPAGATNSSMKIFINHTKDGGAEMELADTVSETCVYRGEFTIPANTGWTTITFDKPFIYNGEDNLKITTFISGTFDFNQQHKLWESISTESNNYSSYSLFDEGMDESSMYSLSKAAIRLISGKSGTAVTWKETKRVQSLRFHQDGNRVLFSIPQTGNVEISIYDLRGRLLSIQSQGVLNAGNYAIPLDKLKLAKGIFVMQLKSGGGDYISRITIK